MDSRAVFMLLALSDDFHRIFDFAEFKIDSVNVRITFSFDLNVKFCRKGVDNGGTNAVKATGNLVSATAELATGMEHRINGFKRRTSSLFLNVDRNSAAVVLNGNAVVFFNGHVDFIAKSGESFIDAVVDNFPDQMVQALRTCRTDVHPRAFSDRFKSFKNLNLAGIIFFSFFFFDFFKLFFISHFCFPLCNCIDCPFYDSFSFLG